MVLIYQPRRDGRLSWPWALPLQGGSACEQMFQRLCIAVPGCWAGFRRPGRQLADSYILEIPLESKQALETEHLPLPAHLPAASPWPIASSVCVCQMLKDLVVWPRSAHVMLYSLLLNIYYYYSVCRVQRNNGFNIFLFTINMSSLTSLRTPHHCQCQGHTVTNSKKKHSK